MSNRTCEDGCNGCGDCTDYYDDNDFGGPTPEEWAWLDANARGASDKLRERIDDLEKGLNEWRELALSQAGDAGIVARMVKAETEVALLHAAMRDEMDEGLRLRELGGALPDENITAMTERVIAERDELRTKRMVDDFVKRDAYRFRKLLMHGKHWLGVFRCDPDGTPSDSISADELSALLDAMDGPEMPPAPEAP